MKNFPITVPVAHRGYHEGCPENSERAFLKAIELGAAIETDIRLTKDNQIVVFHDETLTRMTGVDKKVIDCTLDEIKGYLLEGTDGIPTFQEFLSTLAGKVPLLLEIKNVPEADKQAFMLQIAGEMKEYKGVVAVQSFQPAYVKIFKKLRPDLCCGILASASTGKNDYRPPFRGVQRYVVNHMLLNGWAKPDFISYYFNDFPSKKVDNFKGSVLAWTIRSKEDENYARKFADNIIFENYLPEYFSGNRSNI